MKRRYRPTKPEHKRRMAYYPIPVQMPGRYWERATTPNPEAQARALNPVEKVLERDAHRSTN